MNEYNATLKEVFNVVKNWRSIKSFTKISTYSIKHIIERNIGKYVSEIMLLTALKNAGFKIYPLGGTYRTNISKRELANK